MSNAIAIVPEQFIFAQENELKTTSIKVAEAFGKLHKDVLKKIESLECSKEFHERNFSLMQIDVEIGNSAIRKSPAYEMTKDGFMFLVMGFTGKAAAAIKEAYINAFNTMAAQLFGKRETAALPEPPTITKEQAGILFNLVDEIAGPDGKVRSAVWSRFHRKFKLGSYLNTPADRFEDAKAYLELKLQEYNSGARWHWLDDNEIQALVDERVKAMQGEVLPKKEEKAIPFDISPRWFMHYNSDNRTMTCKPISPECIVVEPERIAEVIADPSGSVYKKDLAAIITAIAKRLSD